MSLDQFLLSADTTDLNYPEIRPTLDLNFARVKTLDPRITFTRASSGSYFGADGILKYAGVNEARFDHNPLTGESLGLLVEEQRTNLVLRSSEISLSLPWAFQSTTPTVATGAFTAPDGSNTATRVTFAAADSRIVQGNLPVVNGTTYTLSLYARPVTAGTLNKLRLACFDSVSQQNSNDLTLVAGWQRISFTFASVGTGLATINIRNELAAANANDIYIWGAQLEVGAFPTSYIPTTTSSRTRAADNAQITGTNFSSWYRQDEGTFCSDSLILRSQIKTQIVWSADGGTFSTSLRQPQGTANQFRAVVNNVFTASTGANLTDGATRAAVAYSGVQGRLQVGIAGADVTGAGTSDAITLSIGSAGGGTQLNGYIHRLTYWPKRLPNAQLRTLTR